MIPKLYQSDRIWLRPEVPGLLIDDHDEPSEILLFFTALCRLDKITQEDTRPCIDALGSDLI